MSGAVSLEAGLLGTGAGAGCQKWEQEVGSRSGRSEVGADNDQNGQAESADSKGDDQAMREEMSG